MQFSIMMPGVPRSWCRYRRFGVTRYAPPAIVGTLLGSAIMNAFAFASQSDGWMTYAAIVLGLVIPALISRDEIRNEIPAERPAGQETKQDRNS
jgi:hypothetical protein